ncbi:MAG: glycosyltransferase [Bacteroidetes bacterium]|nr:glycosyltransferase [Bacteroidota bacterium]
MITSCSILALTIIYAGFILWCHRGWKSIEVANKKANSKLLNVDVVVAIRNEEDTILNLLERLVIQNYPKSNFRIVVIDDHSDDDSFTTAVIFYHIMRDQ